VNLLNLEPDVQETIFFLPLCQAGSRAGRDELTSYDGFHSPDFRSVDISEMFHYRPADSITLLEYVSRDRAEQV
jgi:hypothetical protein